MFLAIGRAVSNAEAYYVCTGTPCTERTTRVCYASRNTGVVIPGTNATAGCGETFCFVGNDTGARVQVCGNTLRFSLIASYRSYFNFEPTARVPRGPRRGGRVNTIASVLARRRTIR